MEHEIKIGKKFFIRNAGKDEYWLQDIIHSRPEVLGLGNLVAVNKEKKQSSGGRLDILLKDPEDNTMYEVEVMLGETDPSHIIRCIEYWDNEKRRYPQRQHFAVLVAEVFDRRYFNVIQLLSQNVPMIAIEADLREVGDERFLSFNKILDVYVEPEEEEEVEPVTEKTWQEKSSWTLALAKKHYEQIKLVEKNIELRYTQSYISIVLNGRNTYGYDKRTKPNSILWFKVRDTEKVESIKALLDQHEIVYTYNKYKDFSFNYDERLLKKFPELLMQIHEIYSMDNSPED
jgi:hypothetical protein